MNSHSRQRGTLALGFVAAAIVGWWAWSTSGEMPMTEALAARTRVVPQTEWLGLAASKPTLVDFVREVPKALGDAGMEDVPVPGSMGHVRTLGPLTLTQKVPVREHLTATLQQALKRWEDTCQEEGRGPDGLKTLADLDEEMNLLLMAKRHQAELAALEKDEYLTTAAGSEDTQSMRFPPMYLTTTVFRVATVGEEWVDVTFGISPENPMVAAYVDECLRMRALVAQASVDEFNALPFPERKEKYERHVVALDRLSSSRTLHDEGQRRALIATVTPDFLPGDWAFDEVHVLARLR